MGEAAGDDGGEAADGAIWLTTAGEPTGAARAVTGATASTEPIAGGGSPWACSKLVNAVTIIDAAAVARTVNAGVARR